MASTPGSARRNGPRGGGANNSENASKLIRENMKCPVCLEVLLPPIYQCETGHNICYLCVDEVTECPLCKSDYGDTRNYFAEELVNSMTFPCKFEEYGCHKTFLGSQLKDHQENCECQPYRCPELACQEMVGIHQMAKHLDKHGFKIMTGDAHQASIEILDDHFDRKTEYNPWRISAFGVEFYTVTTRSKDGLWYFWAYGLGLQKDIKKFSYEIVLFSDEKQLMYRGLVHSLRIASEDIIKNGSCLVTTDNMVKSIRKNGRIKCQVYFIQGKNWDARNKSANGQQGARNAKSTPTQGKKNKIQVPSTATFSCSIPTQLPHSITPKSSRSRVLHNSVKNSALDLLRKDHNSNFNTSASSKQRPQMKSYSASRLRTSSRAKITVTEEEDCFVQQIRETLRCPGCNEVITPPVFQCLIGHNVCHKCKISRQDCALCRAPLGDSRNFFAEELLYKTFQRCPYYKHGCKVCLASAHMRSHEAVCEFAPFECPFNVCRTLLSSDELFSHLQTHQIAVIDKELKADVIVPKHSPSAPVCTIPNILTVNKVPFYPIVVRDTDGSWMFYIITQNNTKYRYELLIKKQSKTIAFQGPVLPLRTNHGQAKLTGLALIAPEKIVKSFKSNDKMAYQVRIVKHDGGPQAKDSITLPSSWVLMSKRGEVVSKTELYANKKTSSTPEEDSDEHDTISVPRHDPVFISEGEDGLDTESEITSEGDASVSLATTRGEDDVSDVESESSRRRVSRSREGKRSAEEVASRTSSKSNTLEFSRDNVVPSTSGSCDKSATPMVDINNNAEIKDDGSIAGGSSMGYSSSSHGQRGFVASTHTLKLVKHITSLSENSSGVIGYPEITEKVKRSRSSMKNRVRMSEDVITCTATSEDGVVLRCKVPSKSQGNLRGSKSKTIPEMPASSPTLQGGSAEGSQVNEFQELKEAIASDPNAPVFEEDGDLLSAKSFTGVTDAVISGGFDVVKSVISLFTSPDTTAKDKKSEEPLEG